MIDAMTWFQQALKSRGTIIGCSGALSNGMNEEVCKALEKFIAEHDCETNALARLFSVYIELSQNVHNYFQSKSDDTEKFERVFGTGTIVVGKNELGYHVTSENVIANADIPPLEKRLEALKTLSKEELKSTYLELLTSRSAKGENVPLGLIDIARKTSGPLHYEFRPKDESFSSFYIKAQIEGINARIEGHANG